MKFSLVFCFASFIFWLFSVVVGERDIYINSEEKTANKVTKAVKLNETKHKHDVNEPILVVFSHSAENPTQECVIILLSHFFLISSVFIIIYGNLDYSMYARIA